jgi:hypothetical protein
LSILPMTPLLDELVERLGNVSPAWRTVARVEADVHEFTEAVGLEPALARGVETIHEGWLLHRGRSRVAAAASPDLALLIGDWCYAAGLRDVTEHGSLDDVRALADLIADVSSRASESDDALDPRWDELLAALHLAYA